MLYICYYHDAAGNFGDDLNLWMWPRLLPGILSADRAYALERDGAIEYPLLVGIGTILDERLPHNVPKAVIGAGFGYGGMPVIDERWTVYAVRGPLTAERLGLDPSVVYTDGAALLATLPLPDVDKRFRYSFMPHHWSTWITDWRRVCDLVGIHYINPKGSVDQVLTEIRQSEVVIAEAMHGAIVADAFRIPWVPVVLHRHINAFKWQDWCGSLSLDYRPLTARFPLRHHVDDPGIGIRVAEKLKLALAARLLHSAKRREPVLSRDGEFSRARDGLVDCLRKFERHVLAGRFDG